MKISSRYIPDRFLPDKALDLIDEAGSKARIDRYFEIKESDQNAGATLDAVSMEQMDQWRQLKEVRTMKELRISEENFEEASLLRAREMEVTKALVANGVASGSISHENLVVGVTEIEHIASCWSGVPVQKITQHESGVLTNMAGTLSKAVVGQAEAVGAVTRAMRRARCCGRRAYPSTTRQQLGENRSGQAISRWFGRRTYTLRHVRIYGKTRYQPFDRCPSRLRWL